MKFGIAIFATNRSIAVTELAREVEDRGFDSLWFPEHSHIPVDTNLSTFPPGGEIPWWYSEVIDPFVAVATAAAVTSRIRIGTGICLVVQRDPIQLAKQVASIDQVSGGRFLFGVGGGWNREEMANHGTRYETRWSLLREKIESMKAIWTNDVAEYHGRFVDFGPMKSGPRPVQTPHPPILIGGNGPGALERVIAYGDGWLPTPAVGDAVSRVPELQRLAAAAGRDPIPVSFYTSGDQVQIERYLGAGLERAIAYVPSDGRAAALHRLDEITAAVEPYRKLAG
jgi:probable F420-dependent oxidoreductase